jgi:hypothetical protein
VERAKMSDPKRNNHSEKNNSESKNIFQELFNILAFKEWILDFLHISSNPRATTFRKASTRAENKLIISIFAMALISALQLFVYWSLRPMDYLTLRNILVVLIWIPFTTILIVTSLFVLLNRGFDYSKISYNSIIYISSIIFSISTILLTVSYLLSTILHQSNKNSIPEYTAILLMYLLITLFGFIYTIILWINFARTLLPVELWAKLMLIIYWTLAIVLAYGVSQFSNMHILNSIYSNQ